MVGERFRFFLFASQLVEFYSYVASQTRSSGSLSKSLGADAMNNRARMLLLLVLMGFHSSSGGSGSSSEAREEMRLGTALLAQQRHADAAVHLLRALELHGVYAGASDSGGDGGGDEVADADPRSEGPSSEGTAAAQLSPAEVTSLEASLSTSVHAVMDCRADGDAGDAGGGGGGGGGNGGG